MRSQITFLVLFLACSTQLSADAKTDWRTWRGPNGNNIAIDDSSIVTSWSEKKNVLWKIDIPGRGHSSPIVVNDIVALTTADENSKTQSVFAVNRATGTKAWHKVLHKGGFPLKTHKKNTHASPTLASDGKALYVTFCNSESIKLTKLTLKGEVEWSITCGGFDPKLFEFGYAPSPLLYGDNVIVVSDYEKGFLAAFKKSNGKEAWRTPRVSQHVSYSSPIVCKVAGKEQLLLSGRNQVASYNPKNGELIWKVAEATTNATCGTMVWEDDLVFASGGYPKKETVAIRADGSKEVVWRNRDKSYEQSMLAYKGYIYAFNDNGIATCFRAKDGKPMWKERLGGPVSASPVLVNGNIYATNEKGITWVYKATPNGYKEIAKNQLGSDSFATPTICGGRIYLRHADGYGKSRKETLYCVGKK